MAHSPFPQTGGRVNALSQFHFIRPEIWWLLLPAGLVAWSVLRRQDSLQGWKAVIAPGLLEHLVDREEEHRGRFRPAYLLVLGWFLGIFAVAGPSWEKEATPFTEDQAALFIVLKVTPDMLAEDIQPSRLQRSVQKIVDLLALRPGSRTGLIAYAGSAHLVMPLTSDPGIIEYFAAELAPDVMPDTAGGPGDDPVQAIELANRRLQASGLPGSIVMLADHIDPEFTGELAARRHDSGFDVHILAMAGGPEIVPPAGSPPAPSLDETAMRQAAKAGGGRLVMVSPDDSDVRLLNAQIDRSIAAAPAQEGERWKDMGYYLLPLFVMMVLLFFRRGGAVALRL
jgi:Ca-activated chloride channel family protein